MSGSAKFIVKLNSKEADLNPSNFDISYQQALLSAVEDILRPNNQLDFKIIFTAKEGSFIAEFNTTSEAIENLENEISIGNILSLSSPEKRKRGFVELKKFIVKNHFYSKITLQNNNKPERELILDDIVKSISEPHWIDSEFVIYGELLEIGGKNKINIHLDTKQFGTVIIKVEKDFIKSLKENLLYKMVQVRVSAKVNSFNLTQVDTNSFELLDFWAENTENHFKEYLVNLHNKAGNTWKGVDADDFISNLR